jgi:hypothetical protein
MALPTLVPATRPARADDGPGSGFDGGMAADREGVGGDIVMTI